jgi:hypothetical protein
MPPYKVGTSLNTIKRRADGRKVRYIQIRSGPQRGKYVHRLLMEAKLGRPLLEEEEVDHIDGDTLNNSLDNLQVLHVTEHAAVTRRRVYERTRRLARAGGADASAVGGG